MSYVNVVVCGHVGKNAEYRVLQGGGAVADFSVATTERWKDRHGAKQEKTSWHSITCFGSTAEVARDYVTKGRLVLVEGVLDYQEWEKDGVKHHRTKIKCMRLVLLGGGGNRRESAGAEDFQVSDDDVPF